MAISYLSGNRIQGIDATADSKTPAQIGNVYEQFDCSQQVSTSAWNDQEGSNNLTNSGATVNSASQNGYDTLQLDGASDTITKTSGRTSSTSASFSWALVIKTPASTNDSNGESFCRTSGSGNDYVGMSFNSYMTGIKVETATAAGADSATITDTDYLNEWIVLIATFTHGGKIRLYAGRAGDAFSLKSTSNNDYDTTDNTVGLGTALYLGVNGHNNNMYFDGHYAEVISFNKALSTTEAEQLGAHLLYKWGITSTAPVDDKASLLVNAKSSVEHSQTNITRDYWGYDSRAQIGVEFASGHALIGESILKVTLRLRTDNASSTDQYSVNLFASDGSIKREFGRGVIGDLNYSTTEENGSNNTTTEQSFTASEPVTIAAEDVLGIKNLGSAQDIYLGTNSATVSNESIAYTTQGGSSWSNYANETAYYKVYGDDGTYLPTQSTFEETNTNKQFTLLYANGFSSAPSWIEMGTGGVIALNTTLNSSLVSGGMISGGSSVYDTTETFSGGTWSPSHDLLRDRYSHAGGGNSTAALIACGSKADGGWANLSSTEKLVSGSWASDVAFAEERYYCSGGGSRTNFLICHGNTGSDAPTYNNTHSWEFDGTSWANSASIGWSCYSSNMGGNATAAVCFGGSGVLTSYAVYDGSSWGSVGNMNNGRYYHGGDGTSSNAIAYHGVGSSNTDRTTETFDGTSWTDRGQSSLSAYSRYGAMACGTGTTAVMGMGKANSVYLNSTEIWDGSAFSTTGNAVSAREYSAGGYA